MYGYNDESDQPGTIRGRRIFCSNRNNRNGCGRTITILKVCFIKGLTFTAKTIWSLLHTLSKGFNKMASYTVRTVIVSNTSLYRLFKRFKLCQSKIRTYLCSIPPPTDSPDPMIQTILHLKQQFSTEQCPVSAFQYTFQTSFF